MGLAGEASSLAVRLWLEFSARPTGRNWYRAHNASIVGGYLEHRDLAEAENRPERFFMNVALVRVLYAHALVGAPRLALGRFAPLGRALGDPRLGMAGAFLSLRRVLPNRYPLALDVDSYIADEQRLGRLFDYAVIVPRLQSVYELVRRGAPRATLARAGSRRQPDLRVALRRATRVAFPVHATGWAGSRTRHQGPMRPRPRARKLALPGDGMSLGHALLLGGPFCHPGAAEPLCPAGRGSMELPLSLRRSIGRRLPCRFLRAVVARLLGRKP